MALLKVKTLHIACAGELTCLHIVVVMETSLASTRIGKEGETQEQEDRGGPRRLIEEQYRTCMLC